MESLYLEYKCSPLKSSRCPLFVSHVMKWNSNLSKIPILMIWYHPLHEHQGQNCRCTNLVGNRKLPGLQQHIRNLSFNLFCSNETQKYPYEIVVNNKLKTTSKSIIQEQNVVANRLTSKQAWSKTISLASNNKTSTV